MTVSIENKAETPNPQEKVDTTLQQQKVDTKTEQKPVENKEAEAQEDPNWRAFREARKKDRLEKEAAEKRAIEKEAEAEALKAAMEAAFAKSTPQQQQNNYQNDIQNEETEDERIEKKVQAAISQREAAYDKARKEREQQEYPNRLIQTYPDFNSMISPENLDYLDYHYPEVSRPLKRLPDDFDKWSDIYKALKKFIPNSTSSKKEAAKADANFAKPKSMSTMNETPRGEGRSNFNMQDIADKRAARYAEMKKIINSVG
jgi:hypothetical protein